MSFNSHRRNYSLFNQNKQSVPSFNRSLRKINQSHPQNQWSLITAKQYYYQNNNMKAAINHFEQYLIHYPQSLQALYLCAISYLHQQKPQLAIPKLHQYLSLRKASQKGRKLIMNKQITSLSNAWLLLSMAYNKINNFQKALEAVHQSIKNDSKFQQGYCYRAKLHMKVGDYQKAEGDYMIALKINKKSSAAYNGIADCYRARFQYQNAVKLYDKVLSLIQSTEDTDKKHNFLKNTPNIPEILLKKNICLYQNNQFEESYKGLLELLQNHKTSEIYYYIALNQIRLYQISIEQKKSSSTFQVKASKCRIFSNEDNLKASEKQYKTVDHDNYDKKTLKQRAILNLQYSLKAQTNPKICGKASKLLIKLFIENYQYYEASQVVQLTDKLKIQLEEYKNIAEGCMLVIKQKYQEALVILKSLYKKLSTLFGDNFHKKTSSDEETEKNSPKEDRRSFFKKTKKQLVILNKKSPKIDEELVWMIPIILLFKAYCQYFQNQFMACLQTYDRYENHLRDYLGKDPQTNIYLSYNKVLCEGVLMLENDMVEESLQKFLLCIDNYYALLRGIAVQPVIFRILGMIKIALSDCPIISEQINTKSKIFSAILEVIAHYEPAVKKSHLIYYYKGLLLLFLNQVDEANEELETCLKLAEQCKWKYLYVKGIAELQRNAPKEAIKQFSAGLILDTVSDLYLGRCISYVILFHSEKEKESIFIQKGFEDLQKFIELEKDKDKISIWVTKILFYNGAFEETSKSLAKVQRRKEIANIEEYMNIFNGVFEEGGVLGQTIMNSFQGNYQENILLVGTQQNQIQQSDYYDTDKYQKWFKILNFYVNENYSELLKILQLSIFQSHNQDELIQFRYNLAIVYMLMKQFSKAEKILTLLAKSQVMRKRAQKISSRNFTQDQCLPDLENELKGVRRLSYYLPYRALQLSENQKIFVKISLPFPPFPKPNICLEVDDEFLLQQTIQSSVTKKIEAPWIKKVTGNIQFTQSIVSSDISILMDNQHEESINFKEKSEISKISSDSFSDFP